MYDLPRLLIDEPPLQVLPSLAAAIGLNEAIFLQQLHYQLRLRQHLIDDIPWIYNTLEQWQGLFPFWSLSTIRRIITTLEQLQLLISANHNARRQVQTRWYTINYRTLHTISMNKSPSQNEQLGCSDWTTELVKMDNSFLPKTFSKEKDNSLTTFENFVGNGKLPLPNSLAMTDSSASASTGKKKKRAITPLPENDWLFVELMFYHAEFDVTALNDEEWWATVANSFPDFSPRWINPALASLARWLMDNPTRRPHTPRGWKQRMNFSLNWFYDKHMRRQPHG